MTRRFLPVILVAILFARLLISPCWSSGPRFAARRRKERWLLEKPKVQSALEADDAAGAITLIEIDFRVRGEYKDVIEKCLSQTPSVYLRTNDAQHLAAAICAGESEIVATDKKLREAALLLGFTVFPPP